jgi:outer membrane protein assembly factor BamB
MATRTAIWLIFVGVLVVAVATFFAWRAIGHRLGEFPASGPGQVAVRPFVREDGTSWTMFAGGQGLLGRAARQLPDSLSVLWKFKTGSEVKSSAAIVDGRAFIGSSDANVYALDLHTGQKLWSYATGDAVESSPLWIDGVVFIGSSDGFLYALEAETGQLKWKYETAGDILSAPNWTRSADGRETWILVGSYDNRLHCVRAESGQAVWTYETDNYVNGSPAVADDTAVFGGCDAMIHAVSLADGTRRTEIDSGSYIAGSAAFLDGQVYVGNYKNVFLRADVDRGEIVWTHTESKAPIFSSPAVTEDKVIFGSRDDLVYALRRDNGRRLWAFKTLGEVDGSPAVCGDKVIVGSGDGRLYMLRLADGKEIWSYEIGRPIVSSPAVAQGVVVIGCDDGTVYAFAGRSPAGETAP